jgi:cytochrome c-type biogenesis protein CcmH
MSDTGTNSSDSAPPAGRASLLVILALLLAAASLWWAFQHQSQVPQAAPGPVGAASVASAPTALALSASQVERGVQQAREDLERDPKSATAWAMLANAESMRGRFAEAGKAYEKLMALRPKDAQVHAEAAEAMAAAQGGRLAGEPARLVAQALALDGVNLKARVLAGKLAFESRRYAEAIQHWERAAPLSQDPAVRRQVDTSLAEARALMSPTGSAPASVPGGLAFVTGRVSVAEALKSRLKPDDIVFVVARPVEGSRMPVALLKRRGADLPMDFALDDTLSMVPQSRLSQHREVQIRVLVSKRGDAIAVSGDLQGQAGPVAVGSSGVKLEITDVVP